MKLTVVLLALLGISFAKVVPNFLAVEDEEDGTNMSYFVYEKEDGSLAVEDLRESNVEAETTAQSRAKATDIKYYFSSSLDPETTVEVGSQGDDFIVEYDFQANRKTFFLIHGWRNDKDSKMNNLTRNALLTHDDVNVFIVDWSSKAQKGYLTAKGAVESIGELLGAFIESLRESKELDLANTVLVGHSLGAHIAGIAGAFLEGNVGEIVGLDPAYPLFSKKKISTCIDPTDAQYVQIIHTGGGLVAFKADLGHSDYYPNGGSSQSGCGLDLVSTCAHGRSYQYYSESVATGGFVSTQCDSYSNYKDGDCDGNDVSYMGGFEIDETASGKYYLKTNKKSPFSKE